MIMPVPATEKNKREAHVDLPREDVLKKEHKEDVETVIGFESRWRNHPSYKR